MTAPRVTHTGGQGGWHGAIAVGRRIVWTCPHHHVNRDQSSTVNHSAHDCARVVLLATTNPTGFDAARKWAGYRSAAAANFYRDLYAWAASIADDVRARIERA